MSAAAVRVRWPTRTDLVRASIACAQDNCAALLCPVCAEFMYEPMSCTACGGTICVVCFCMLADRPRCPSCRADSDGGSWMRNIAARDALLASPAHRDAYLARHDALAANPLLVVTASVRHIVGDAHLRWSPGLRVDQALPMFRAALCALRRHTDKTAAAAAGGATAASPAGAGAAATAVHPVPATSTSPRGLIVTRIPPRDASALPQHSSLVYACTSEWGNWVEFQSPTLGYAICAQASTDVQGACAS